MPATIKVSFTLKISEEDVPALMAAWSDRLKDGHVGRRDAMTFTRDYAEKVGNDGVTQLLERGREVLAAKAGAQ